jgi:dipeptidyl aminopeptidase/acylaminoacyl peptidase
MQVRQIEDPGLSADGAYVAFTAEPDRGDPEVVVRAVQGGTRHVIARAQEPVLSADGRWVAARTVASLEARETSDDPPRNGLAILALSGGEVERIDDVRTFAFSPDGTWLAWHHLPPEAGGEEEGATNGAEDAPGEDGRPGEAGTRLVLRELATGTERRLEDVRAWAWRDDGGAVAFTVAGDDPAGDALRILVPGSSEEVEVDARPGARYAALAFRPDSEELAFFVGPDADGDGPVYGRVRVWDGSAATDAVGPEQTPEGWVVPSDTELEWSDDGERLFLGWRPLRPDETGGRGEGAGEPEPGGADEATSGAGDGFDPYDPEAILEDRAVDVWHWRDLRIMPQQKVVWDREKDRTYGAVWHRDGGEVVALAGPDLPDLEIPGNPDRALAGSDLPYRRAFTWAGGRSDAYLVDLETGARTRFAEGIRSRPSLSPDGRYAVWWEGGAYHLFDAVEGTTRNLTEGLGVPMADEDHDYPDPAPGYGVAGWMEDDRAVLLYDKYDIWVVPTGGEEPWSLTDGRGRAARRIFRIVDTDEDDDDALAEDDAVLLSSYHDLQKNHGFYRAVLNRPGVSRLLEEEKRFRFVAAADEADRYLYTREDYDEFPDLWVADTGFQGAREVTDVNPGLTETFAWGTSELVEWESADGIPLQGVVIKPDDYEEGRRYPVLVYYYRFFSQRLHEFNDPSVNHRPSFPVYASDGYVVFLPDVRFEVGRPGLAATKSVVPGVQKLVELGIADPDRIALHGHSWSGYQTAFIVTQTDLFATAIAGAPVANMTSAYSGIRLGSGLARQFQYEMGQSRISGSLWEARDEYIDNSPVFFADRIDTPLLILHGDVDDAVPWEQSIELYLALRRLDKESVFLQYRDEPHHPQRYANKLDWAVKMKEWVDHYLKGTPAPAWIEEGIPYTGR